jgi:hypothetical protein
VPSFDMLRRVGLAKTDVSEESVASICRTRNQRAADVYAGSLYFPPKRLFMYEPHGAKSQKVATRVTTATIT